MQTIVHKIRLKPGCAAEAFERWVREVDYVAAERLSSVVSFAVNRCANPEAAGADYFEVITVSAPEAFEADMRSELFASLVATFDTMAVVIDELEGSMIGQGYR